MTELSNSSSRLHNMIGRWIWSLVTISAGVVYMVSTMSNLSDDIKEHTPSVPKLLSNLCSNNEIKLKQFFLHCFVVWKCRSLKHLLFPESLNFVTLCKFEFWRNGPRQAEECVHVVVAVPYRGHEMRWRKHLQTSPHGQGRSWLDMAFSRTTLLVHWRSTTAHASVWTWPNNNWRI
jgi:hypothetical protein